jgi:NOL1/NOP2/sun family putative RNA methylase
MKYTPKPKFIERMNLLLENEEDVKRFFEIAEKPPRKSIRVNTLIISPSELKKRLIDYNWKFSEPCINHPEIIKIDSELEPGELGKAREHLLGYYYIQEITSMMPIIALKPGQNDIFLDLCASPGSKTTQASSEMKNSGVIIANDVSIKRIMILSANLEKNKSTNFVLTRDDGISLCNRLKKLNMKFTKILVDAPCSGEGNIRTSPRTFLEWSEGLLKNLSKKQKILAANSFELLKLDGEMVYSTCTHSPEENEEVIQYLLETFKDKIEILDIDLPLKTRPGITEWKNKKFSSELKKAKRIYPHDNDMEGFFLCKLRRVK